MSQRVSGLAPIGDGELRFEIDGSGPPVVFGHGFSLDVRLWEPQLASLAGSRTVVRYDLRGFGRSTPAAAPYNHSEDLLALLDHLGFERAALVGLSLGGAVALGATLLAPQRVERLALLDSLLPGFPYGEAFRGEHVEICGLAGERGLAAAKERWLASPLFAPALANPAAAPRLREMVADYSGWHWTERDPVRSLKPPLAERLREAMVPALVIVGELDIEDFRSIADRLAGGIPGARRVTVPGAGHLPNLERPETVNRELAQFLAAP